MSNRQNGKASAESQWWRVVRNESSDEGDVYIYGIIDDIEFWGDEQTPKMLLDDLARLGDVGTLNVHINSPGGSVFSGQAIHTILRNHDARKVVTVDGIAASIASVIAMAGDEIVMPRNSMMMVHNPQGLSFGEAEDHRRFADTLDQVRATIVAAYNDKTGVDADKINDYMAEETWFTAEEAVEAGFADRVDERTTVEACVVGRDKMRFDGLDVDSSKFQNSPKLPWVRDERPDASSPTGLTSEVDEVSQAASIRDILKDVFDS